MKTCCRAFSLVELLIIVTIVSVLAAMLLPALEQSVLQARMAACAGNLRQQGHAFTAYANDNRGFWPYRPGDNMEPWRWMRPRAYGPPYIDHTGRITPYLPPSELYACPASGLDWRQFWTTNTGEWPGYVIYAGLANDNGTYVPVLPWTTSFSMSGSARARWRPVSPLRAHEWPDRPIAGDALFFKMPSSNNGIRILSSADYCYSSPHVPGHTAPGAISPTAWIGRTTDSSTPPTHQLYPDGAVIGYSSGFYSIYGFCQVKDFLFGHRKELGS